MFRHVEELAVEMGVEVHHCQRVLLTRSEMTTSGLVLALEREWNTYRQLNDERKSQAFSLGGASYSPGHGQYKVDPCLGASPRLTPVREHVRSRSLSGSQSEVDPCQGASLRLIPVREPL